MNSTEKLNLLLMRDKTWEKDFERRAMFLIFSGNQDLFSKVDCLYDFKKHQIKPDSLECEVSLCSSAVKLLELAFNHYNGYPADVYNCLYVLDQDNFDLAIESMKMRYQKQ